MLGSHDFERWNAEDLIAFLYRDLPADIGEFHTESFRRDERETIGQLKPLGYDFYGFRATEFATKPYNLLPSRKGSSRARIVVWDGKQTLGKTLSFVLITRLDEAKEWGPMHSHAPIPGYWDTRREYVTSTEYNAMHSVARDLRVPFAVFPLGFGSKGGGSYFYWERARNWIDAYEKAPTIPIPPKIQACR